MESTAHPASARAVPAVLQFQGATPSNSTLLSLPNELILEVASYLNCFTSSQGSRDFNALAQTCRHLRNILYPIVNQHLWFDEETQFPDTLLNIVIYSFTDPLVDYIRSATFRLRTEDGFWLRDEYDGIIESQIARLKGYLKEKADEGNEVFEYFGSQIDEYGVAVLPTILLFQLKELKDIELAASINATSSKFMLTTLHYFKPPFQLERLGILRLTDFAPVNFWLLERLLRLGTIKTLGIDYRWGSVAGRPKIRPVPELPSDAESEFEPEIESDDDDLSVGSLEPEYHATKETFSASSGARSALQKALRRTVKEEIEEDYKGYQPLGWVDCGDETDIDYDLPGADSISDAATFEIRDLRLWMDETPPAGGPLIDLLCRITGLQRLDLNSFNIWGYSYMGYQTGDYTLDHDWLRKFLKAQESTLETFTIRATPLAASQPNFVKLFNFDRLRKVHLFYSVEMFDAFHSSQKLSEPFFKKMLPKGLELLRIDFCFRLQIIGELINLRTEDFPSLRVVLGLFKDENTSGEVAEGLKEFWTGMPYSGSCVSGIWTKLTEEPDQVTWGEANEPIGSNSSTYDVWRRQSLHHVPIQFVNITGIHKGVWCNSDGWHGPFQSHALPDYPWDPHMFWSLPLWYDEWGDLNRLDAYPEPWRGSTPEED
ncbi:hypothetical protein TWF281_005147 [Arthrobotrys megalospora]